MDSLASNPLLGLIIAGVAFVLMLVGGAWVRRIERSESDTGRERRPTRADEEERSVRAQPPRPRPGLLPRPPVQGAAPAEPVAPRPVSATPAVTPPRKTRRRRRQGTDKG